MVLLLTLASCTEKKKESTEEPKKNDTTQTIDPPENIISLEEANVIYDNYSQHRVPIIQSYESKERKPNETFEASRFVDFDYETIKKYIDYLDQESKKAGVDKITKLRLYFANYPDTDTFPNGREVIHKRQNSIFMVPTLNKNGINYGFYVGQDGKAALIQDWAREFKEQGIDKNEKQHQQAGFSLNFNLLKPTQSGSKSLALNFGQGGPPPKTDF